MGQRLKPILDRFLEFWNKYNKKQKIIIISSIAALLIAVGILSLVLNRTEYEVLTTCEGYAEMNEVTTLLNENGYTNYKIPEGTYVIQIPKKDLVNAEMLLASSNIQVSGYSLEDALESSFSTTESDKNKRWAAYVTSELQRKLETFDFVKSATVNLTLSDTSTNLFTSDRETSVAVILKLTDEISEEMAEDMAIWIKTAVGNKDTTNITILSTTGEALYSGASAAGGISSSNLNKQLKYVEQMQSVTSNSIRNQILSSGVYNDVKVTVSFDVNWSNLEKITHEYSVPEGAEQGYFSTSYEEASKGGSAAGGQPGTASNDDDTTYYIDTGNGTTTEYTLNKYDYLVNEVVTTETMTPGDIILDSSTISVVLTKNVIYEEDAVRELGYLDDMSWDEFKANNAESVMIEHDQSWEEIVAYGTGIPMENVRVVAYEKHWFYDSESTGRPVSFYIQILLALLIVGLLAFVVFRSARPVAVQETEPELSVEDMLATTKEAQQSVEDIDLQEKSEVRKAIEKFVDENPEAVALLLRNWLDDGWN